MGDTETTASSKRTDAIKHKQATARYDLYLKVLVSAVAVLTAMCMVLIAVFSWHISQTDQEVAKLKADINKLVTVDEHPNTRDQITVQPMITFDEALAIMNQTDVKSFLFHECRAIIKPIERRFDEFNATADDAIEQIHQKIEDLEQKTGQVMDDIDEAFDQMDDIRGAVDRLDFDNTPGFVANLRMADDGRILFDLLRNEGNHYNLKNNVFTAPTEGVYIISLKIQCLPPTTELQMHLMKNEKIVAEVTGVHNNVSTCAATYLVDVLRLGVGDTVNATVAKFESDSFGTIGLFSGKLHLATET